MKRGGRIMWYECSRPAIGRLNLWFTAGCGADDTVPLLYAQAISIDMTNQEANVLLGELT